MNNKNHKKGKNGTNVKDGQDDQNSKNRSSKNSKRVSTRALPAAGDVEHAATGRRVPGRKRASTRSRLPAERVVLPVIVGGPWDVGARGAHRIVVRAEYVKRLCVSVRYANLRDQ